MLVEDNSMDQRAVSSLEREIEEAVAIVVTRMGRDRLPLLPSQKTMHLMAKAAVTAFEAAVETDAGGD